MLALGHNIYFQLCLTIPAPFCVPLSRLARGENTKMCECVGEGRELGGGWVIWMSHVHGVCMWTAQERMDREEKAVAWRVE